MSGMVSMPNGKAFAHASTAQAVQLVVKACHVYLLLWRVLGCFWAQVLHGAPPIYLSF